MQYYHNISRISGNPPSVSTMASFGTMFEPNRKVPGSWTRVKAGQEARLRRAKMESLKRAEQENFMMFVGFRKLDIIPKLSSEASSRMDNEPPKKKLKLKKERTQEEKEKRNLYEQEKHALRLAIFRRVMPKILLVPDLPEEQLFSMSIFKGFQGPNFRSSHAYIATPENLSSPWEAKYQSCEKYEEDLSLLLQDFEAKSRHSFAVTGRWPVQAEVGALLLAFKLRGKEWRKVKNNGTYMENLDNAWRAKRNKFREEKVFQVVWEFVAGMSRDWDEQRHQDCYFVKHGLYLPRIPSTQRKQKFIDLNRWTRARRHDLPKRQPSVRK